MSTMNGFTPAQTIFARATGPGTGGVAVVRVSGPGAGVSLLALGMKALPTPRHATLVRLVHPETKTPLDDALVLWFPAPNSFTGEDTAELHLHGGIAVCAAVLEALGHVDGLRTAEAGEFARRAFINGKLDLTQVEGLADLIASETEAQRKQALQQAEGALGSLYDDWRERLLRALALVEAVLDFAEEELPDDIVRQAMDAVRDVLAEMQKHLKDDRAGERLRSGLRLAIVGPPNAGKSSLMNALAKRDAAIVSDIAGTTRDVVEVHLDLAGYPLLVADTAGLRRAGDSSGDTIELEGVKRARAWAAAADIKLCVFDGAALPELDGETLGLIDDDTLVAINKSDMSDKMPDTVSGKPALALSVKTGDGIDVLLDALARDVVARCEGAGGAPVPTRHRHREHLSACVENLERFVGDERRGADELGAEDLRLAVRNLGRITGRVDVEELLDLIFSEFCIGK